MKITCKELGPQDLARETRGMKVMANLQGNIENSLPTMAQAATAQTQRRPTPGLNL